MSNRAVLLAVAWMAGLSFQALAQAPLPPPSQPYDQQPADQQPAPAAPLLSPQELSNLVAPVALYPDLLLSQVLAASTYPAEIAQARDWMAANPGLRGRDVVEAAKQQSWDPSVQALVAFPDVINLLTRDIQWTTDLGNAFLADSAGVMDAIQRLRASARASGRLADTAQQRVTDDSRNGQGAIVIQPRDPQVVYAPVYNPAYVWGPPAYGAYPPLAYPPIGYGIAYGVGAFLGVLFSGLFSFGGWGWGLSWLTHGLFLNGLFFSHFGFHAYGGYGFRGGPGFAARAAWVHDPGHRLGVPYGGHSAGARYSGGFGSRGGFGGQGWNRAQPSAANRSYSAGRSAFAGSRYQGSSRQMEAYRGLTVGSRGAASRSSEARPSAYGSSRSYGGAYSGAASGGGYRGYSGASSYGRSSPSYRGSSAQSYHYAAPKSSGHSGGGGRSHSSGGGHSHSGGGHSHGGGSHKK